MKRVIVILAMLSCGLFGQVIYNSGASTLTNTALRVYKINGFGSMGFNREINMFNPRVEENIQRLAIYAGANFNLDYSPDTEKQYYYSTNEVDDYFTVMPDFAAYYSLFGYAFQINYRNNYHFTNGGMIHIPISEGFSDKRMEEKLEYSTLQISISRKFSEIYTLSVGIITDNYLFTKTYIRNPYNEDSSREKTLESEIDFFDEIRFHLGLNVSLGRNAEAYFVTKSGNSTFNEEVIYRRTYLVEKTPDEPLVQIPAMYAVGGKFEFTRKLSASLEIMHESVSDGPEDENFKPNADNTSLTVGGAYISSSFGVGVSGTFYTQFESTLKTFNTSSPYFITLNGKYKYGFITAFMDMQYGISKYEINFYYDNEKYTQKQVYLKAGVMVGL